MKLNQNPYNLNRSFVISAVAVVLLSALAAELLSDYENYLDTTLTIAVGYVVGFVIFACIFYNDNKQRFKNMKKKAIKRELIEVVSCSFCLFNCFSHLSILRKIWRMY